VSHGVLSAASPLPQFLSHKMELIRSPWTLQSFCRRWSSISATGRLFPDWGLGEILGRQTRQLLEKHEVSQRKEVGSVKGGERAEGKTTFSFWGKLPFLPLQTCLCFLPSRVHKQNPFPCLFLPQDIDGQALLLLTLPTVQECMELKLGPAIKLCHQIERVKVAFYAQYAN